MGHPSVKIDEFETVHHPSSNVHGPQHIQHCNSSLNYKNSHSMHTSEHHMSHIISRTQASHHPHATHIATQPSVACTHCLLRSLCLLSDVLDPSKEDLNSLLSVLQSLSTIVASIRLTANDLTDFPVQVSARNDLYVQVPQ